MGKSCCECCINSNRSFDDFIDYNSTLGQIYFQVNNNRFSRLGIFRKVL